VSLVLLHPEVAYRSCEDCANFLYGDDGLPIKRNGQKVPRPPRVGTPCRTCPKIPADVALPSPMHSIELDARGWLAYQFWERCEAVGIFPDDEAVAVVARAISGAVRNAERIRDEQKHARLIQTLAAIATAAQSGRQRGR
jgi:hypothetical protein